MPSAATTTWCLRVASITATPMAAPSAPTPTSVTTNVIGQLSAMRFTFDSDAAAKPSATTVITSGSNVVSTSSHARDEAEGGASCQGALVGCMSVSWLCMDPSGDVGGQLRVDMPGLLVVGEVARALAGDA